MDKQIIKSVIISLIFHILVIIFFSFFVNFPEIEKNLDFKPLEIEIKSNLFSSNFPSNIQTKESYQLKQTKKPIESIYKEKKKESLNDTLKQTIKNDGKSQDNIEKPLIAPIENKSSETKIDDNKNIEKDTNPDYLSSTNISNSSTNESSSNESDESDISNLVQQLINTQIGETSGQSSKENIQWNSGANRWVVKKIKPVLPEKYKKKGNSIICKIYIEINKFGTVISAIIIQSSGFIELDQYIISIIKDWKFNQVTYDKIDSGYITILFLFN